ncbi:MAG: radical SAM protein [Elusimicrobiales bacterium]|nr:radical SAM protein [Elusimicrobiales bacterium]
MRAAFRKAITSLLTLRLLDAKRLARVTAYGLRKFILREKIPGTAVVALTFKCFCKCGCCASGIFSDYFKDAMLPFEEAERLIPAIAAAGTPRLHLTGGDPLAHKDLAAIARLASERGLVTFVETSAVTLTEEIILALKEAGVTSVNISLDSSDPALHDSTRGVSGCFSRAAEMIGLCVKHGQPCMISTYATRESIYGGDIFKLVSFAREAGCSGIRILAPQPSGNWIENEAVILKKEDADYLEARLPLFFPVYNRTPQISCPLKDGYKIFVLPDGNFAPCEHLPYIFKDSKDMDLGGLQAKINSYDFFRGEYACIPRSPEYRREHPEVAKRGGPIFI